MSSFRFTPLAEHDLEDLVDWLVEQATADTAEHVVNEILGAAARLAGMPHIGHVRPDLTDEPVMFWSVYSWLIVYRPETRPLEIVRVVSGLRDVATLLRNDDGGRHGAPH